MRLFAHYRARQIHMLITKEPDITVKQIAYELQISLRTVYRAMEQAQIDRRCPDVKSGSIWQKNNYRFF